MSEAAKWKAFDLAKIVSKAETQEAPYLEFLRVPSLSAGIYTLEVGSTDTQTTHDEDEVYFVLKGRGTITLGGQPQAIAQGSILYVPADTEHEFTEISEDLSLLVFFGSGGPSGADV
jgi:mannose-6-phosphate isomerase-like protein (cupin superfamily)